MLHKNLANSVKDVDATRGVVCGYASSFNVVDEGNDMVLPGAFTKTIADQGPQAKQPRIKFLYQHDSTAILGVPHVLKEDGFGLYFEAKIADTSLGRDVLTLYEAGVITEHSIGYETVRSEWERTKAVRLLQELKLYEFSSVTWGMNPETPTVAVKSLTHLDALATKAARIDDLLHNGTLRSDALCETLERELKALHAALAPESTDEPEARPYDLGRVLDSMNDLRDRLGRTKAATQADKDAQEARSKKYSIGIKDGGNVTKPSKWKDVPDEQWGDPVNYRYPMKDKAHADNAASRFGAETARAQYTADEVKIIEKRIADRQKDFGESDDDDDSGKSAMAADTRLIKGTGGDLEVSADGTHAAYTGTHTHSHKAMGSQGGDEMHSHSHTHDGNAKHSHSHSDDGKHAHALAARQHKTFAEHYQDEQCADLLEDWQDVVLCAFTAAVYDAFQIGDQPEADVNDALDGLKEAVGEWVACAVKFGLSDYLDEQGYDYDGGTLYRMQQGASNGYGGYGWMSRDGSRTAQKMLMPDAPPRLRKTGRAISSANRTIITDALDGMSEAMKSMKAHHGAIADLMTKTDPDAVRQDEDDVEGDSDTENGGTDPNKQQSSSYTTTTPRRTAAGSTPRAGTTHAGETDLSAIVADLDALKGRLVTSGNAHAAGGKAR